MAFAQLSSGNWLSAGIGAKSAVSQFPRLSEVVDCTGPQTERRGDRAISMIRRCRPTKTLSPSSLGGPSEFLELGDGYHKPVERRDGNHVQLETLNVCVQVLGEVYGPGSRRGVRSERAG